MSFSQKSLSLSVTVQDKTLTFVLPPGKTIYLGRDPTCDLHVPLDSISQKHLSIEWNGQKLIVKDLESSNGTFRMPQDSPFLEVLLDPKEAELNLRLAKVPVVFLFEKIDATEVLGEKTEVLNTKDHSKNPPQAPIDRKENLEAGVKLEPKIEVAHQEELPRPKIEKSVADTVYGVGSFFIAGLFATVVHTLFILYKYSQFFDVSIDAYLFWWSDRYIFLGLWVLSFLVFWFLRKKISYWDYLPSFEKKLLNVFGALFFVLPLLWPVYFLHSHGNIIETWKSGYSYFAVQDELKTHDFSDKSKNLKISTRLGQISPQLVGSSVYYTFWHNFQKKRVVGECGGLGEEEWSKKRFCLVLLYALALEAYADIRPVRMNKTASHLVLLASLDGIIRVLSAEGPGSENLKLFINSLEEVGLDEEVAALVKFVQTFRGRSFEDLMQGLLEIRFRLERDLRATQRQAHIPSKMQLNLSGPLEMGI